MIFLAHLRINNIKPHWSYQTIKKMMSTPKTIKNRQLIGIQNLKIDHLNSNLVHLLHPKNNHQVQINWREIPLNVAPAQSKGIMRIQKHQNRNVLELNMKIYAIRLKIQNSHRRTTMEDGIIISWKSWIWSKLENVVLFYKDI